MRKQGLTKAQEMEIRTMKEAKLYLASTSSTVRSVAKKCCVSKSTVHRDFKRLLPDLDENLSALVNDKIDTNLNERASRGGQSLARKYAAGLIKK